MILLLLLSSVSPASRADDSTPAATASPAGSTERLLNQQGSLVRGRHKVLFIGNSYIYTHDVPGRYRTLVGHAWPDVRLESVAPGGYRLARHAADARRKSSQLGRWLRAGTVQTALFDAVVLQEQSQVGGFPMTDRARQASVAGASELAAMAGRSGATTVLYLTWGRRDGDQANAGYETFSSMQDALDRGYLELARILRQRGNDVRLAPVGGGFRIIHDDIVAAGGDPHGADSDFVALYESDGSHPSRRGAYLAACILAGTVTAADPHDFGKDPKLGPATSTKLQDVCARALLDPRWRKAPRAR